MFNDFIFADQGLTYFNVFGVRHEGTTVIVTVQYGYAAAGQIVFEGVVDVESEPVAGMVVEGIVVENGVYTFQPDISDTHGKLVITAAAAPRLVEA